MNKNYLCSTHWYIGHSLVVSSQRLPPPHTHNPSSPSHLASCLYRTCVPSVRRKRGSTESSVFKPHHYPDFYLLSSLYFFLETLGFLHVFLCSQDSLSANIFLLSFNDYFENSHSETCLLLLRREHRMGITLYHPGSQRPEAVAVLAAQSVVRYSKWNA